MPPKVSQVGQNTRTTERTRSIVEKRIRRESVATFTIDGRLVETSREKTVQNDTERLFGFPLGNPARCFSNHPWKRENSGRGPEVALEWDQRIRYGRSFHDTDGGFEQDAWGLYSDN